MSARRKRGKSQDWGWRAPPRPPADESEPKPDWLLQEIGRLRLSLSALALSAVCFAIDAAYVTLSEASTDPGLPFLHRIHDLAWLFTGLFGFAGLVLLYIWLEEH